MKTISSLLTIIILFFSQAVSAQTMSLAGRSSGSGDGGGDEGVAVDFSTEVTLKDQIDDLGLEVANALMRCCSSWGGNNIYGSVDYTAVRFNSSTGTFTIPMQVGWTGSLSGARYWIKGKLRYSSTGDKQWLKIADSGGFNGGCGQGCIN